MPNRANERPEAEVSTAKRPPYIVISGNIGTGKSSLSAFLQYYLNVEVLFEPNDENPYLPDFYKDMKQWAFHSQLWFLSRKIMMAKQIANRQNAIIQDRTIYEDAEVFCRNLHLMRKIRKRDFELYMTIYSEVLPLLPKPDLLIYLKCPIRVIRKRIKQRGRRIEKDLPYNYLRRLQRLYDEWRENYTLSPVIDIDSSKIDFVSDLIDQSELLTTLKQYIK